jgi:transposase
VKGFVRLIKVEDRAERQRRDWITAYRALGDAGAVCRRFGVSRPTSRKWLRRYERAGEAVCVLEAVAHIIPRH